MTGKVPPIPKGLHSITPYLTVDGAEKAIEFYQKAFGANLLEKHAMPDGKIMHSKLQIGNSVIMISDEFPESQCGTAAPTTLKSTTIMLHLYVDDADATFNQAIQAGATSKMPLIDAFWGDRYGQIQDPFGHIWSVSTQKEILTDEEVAERSASFFANK